MTDTDLLVEETGFIRRAQQGDTAAFEWLMNQHAPYVYNLIYRIVKNKEEAEDLSQEVFVRAWKHIGTFRGDAKFKTWLYKVATNLCYNRLPKLKREVEASDPSNDLTLVGSGERLESQVITNERSQLLYQALLTLPEKYRLLLTLRHVQAFSYAEIAEVTSLPLGTVKTGIFRARKMLKERLEASGDGIHEPL